MNFFLKLFKLLPPEIAHSLSLNSLNILYKLNLLSLIAPNHKTTKEFFFQGMVFKNKLGTAAGLDKNGDFIDALGALGFGFLEVGTVTPIPQYGNTKPRVFRNFKEDSIINRLGFNNKGVDYLVKKLKSKKSKNMSQDNDSWIKVLKKPTNNKSIDFGLEEDFFVNDSIFFSDIKIDNCTIRQY